MASTYPQLRTDVVVGSTREKLRLGVIRLKGLQWPLFLYKDQKYDPKHPWSGLLRSEILRKVSDIVVRFVLPLIPTLRVIWRFSEARVQRNAAILPRVPGTLNCTT